MAFNVCTATFETGAADGDTILIADPGEATQWDAITQVGTGTCKYSTTHPAFGLLAGKFTVTGGSGLAYAEWQTGHLGSGTDHFGGMYLYKDATPNNNVVIYQAWNTGLTQAQGSVGITTGNKIICLQNVSSVSATGAVNVPSNQLVYISWHIVNDATVGKVEARLYTNPGSGVIDETITTANGNNGAGTQRVRIGNEADGANNNTILNLWLDNITTGNASYPTPVLTATNLNLALLGAGS